MKSPSVALRWSAGLAIACLMAAAPEEKGEPTDRTVPSETPPAVATPPIKTALPQQTDRDNPVTCANLVYAGSKSSRCFSDKFLDRVERETNIVTDRNFRQVKLADEEMYRYPFAIMTGEGSFTLQEAERKNLKAYLTRGGFLLASAGCSSEDWDRSFRTEMKKLFPGHALQQIKLDHSIYHTVFDITNIRLKRGGSTLLEGIEVDGKTVVVYSPQGLNDTGNAGSGCCCCGGNEIENCQEVNVNIITYALTH